MHRSIHRLVLVSTTFVVALSLMIFCSTRSIAQDKKDDHGDMAGHDMSGMQQPSKEEMEKMMQAGTPGPEHQEMMKSAGDWDAEVRMNMNGQWSPPSKGTMHIEPLFDGRYMLMKFDGVMNMGGGDMPFKGMGISGYDNTTKKYFSTWIDSTSTAMMKTEGTKEGNVLTLTGKMNEPGTDKEVMIKEVVTHTDNDHMTYQMFGPGQDGKEMQMVEIKYTRKM